MRRAVAVLSLWVALAAPDAAAQERFRIYEPKSRTAEELAPLVARLLGPEGAAVPDPHGGRLILEGDPAAIQAALEALRELDAPLHQYRVESRVTSRSALEHAGLAAAAWIDRGGLLVARVAAEAGAAHRQRSFSGEVVVLEGSRAELWTGSSQLLHSSPGSALVPVRSGLRVRPLALGGGGIELEVTPVVSELEGGELARSGAIRETGASTRVRVRPGEELALAGVASAGSGAGADVFRGAEAHSDASDSVIVLRVTPTGEAAASPEP